MLGLYNKLGSLPIFFNAHLSIHSFIQSINIYLMLGIILGLGATAVDKTHKVPTFMEQSIHSEVGKAENKGINRQVKQKSDLINTWKKIKA